MGERPPFERTYLWRLADALAVVYSRVARVCDVYRSLESELTANLTIECDAYLDDIYHTILMIEELARNTTVAEQEMMRKLEWPEALENIYSQFPELRNLFWTVTNQVERVLSINYPWVTDPKGYLVPIVSDFITLRFPELVELAQWWGRQFEEYVGLRFPWIREPVSWWEHFVWNVVLTRVPFIGDLAEWIRGQLDPWWHAHHPEADRLDTNPMGWLISMIEMAGIPLWRAIEGFLERIWEE